MICSISPASEEVKPTKTSTEQVTSLADQATSVAIVTHDGNTNSDQSETTTNQDQSSTPGIIDAGALNIGAITSGLVILLLLISLSIIMIVVLTLLVVAKRKKKESYIIKHDAADNPNALGACFCRVYSYNKYIVGTLDMDLFVLQVMQSMINTTLIVYSLKQVPMRYQCPPKRLNLPWN